MMASLALPPAPLPRDLVRLFAAASAFAAMLGTATGCAPTTQYRYSGYTPATHPVAWDGRTPPEGTVTFEGTLVESGVRENLAPQVGDTALMVPQWTAEGAAFVSIVSRVQLGLRASFASYDWAQPSAAGTMPVPGAPLSWGLGPEMRVSVPLDKARRFHLGIVGNVMDTRVPYAEWTLTGPLSNPMTPPCTASSTCVSSYQLARSQTETDLVYSFGLVPSYAFGPDGAYGHVFLGLTAGTGFQNDGFATTQQSGSSIKTSFPLMVASAGYAGNVDALLLSGTLFRPLTDGGSPINYDFGFLFTVGLNLSAWEPRHADL